MLLERPAFDYPLTEGRSCVCLEEGQFCVYLDRNAALELLFSLHWFATEKPIGEEVDIWSRDCTELPCKGKPIGLCELKMVEAHRHKKQGKNILKQAQPIRYEPHGIYSAECDRLDYYISPEEAEAAYEALTVFLSTAEDRPSVGELMMFDTLVVRMIVGSKRDR
jgi:hypothetical protein